MRGSTLGINRLHLIDMTEDISPLNRKQKITIHIPPLQRRLITWMDLPRARVDLDKLMRKNCPSLDLVELMLRWRESRAPFG
jgi:hypothetical protein